MFPKATFEKEGDGRYLVHVETGCRPLRIGRVLGGNGKWAAENLRGVTTGYAPTREKAAGLIMSNLALDRVICDGVTFIAPRLTLEEYFERHEYRELYVKQYGGRAFAEFVTAAFQSWLNTFYGVGYRVPLSRDEMHYLGAVMREYLHRDPRDICRSLVIGEREGRWDLPPCEGVLTEGYWHGLGRAR